jgi:hypothetical protein
MKNYITAQLKSLHYTIGGSSINIEGTTPTCGYAVALPWTSRVRSGRKLTTYDIGLFVEDHFETVSDSNGNLVFGTWYDQATNQSYMELSLVVDDRQAARALGKQLKQIAIYDFQYGKVITLEAV